MKRLVTFLVFLVCFGLSSQTISSLNFEDSETSEENEQVGTLRILAQKNQMVEQADAYYEERSYAEAARLYQEALEDDIEMQSMNALKRAGDAYYFDSDLKKALFWYDKLYTLYGKDVLKTDILKYSHTLQETGQPEVADKLIRKLIEDNKSLYDIDEAPNKEIKVASIKNLNINSPFSNSSAMFYGESDVVFASVIDSLNTKKYKKRFLNLYIGKSNPSEELGDIRKFSKKINSKKHEAAMAFSTDRNTIYFTRKSTRKKSNRNGAEHSKLYTSKKVSGKWTKPIELPFNDKTYSTGQPAVSPDGKKLYFVSDMPGGFGGSDIYVVDILGENRFSEPKNLGRGINTDKEETFPYITDNELYFSSDRGFGFGGLDIYKSHYESGFFEVPVNLGEPYNSTDDDFSYIVNRSEDKGYFTSNRQGGKGGDDIYAFKVNTEENFNAIAGLVIDSITDKNITFGTVTLIDQDDNNLEVAKTKIERDGSYVFENLKPYNNYALKISTYGYDGPVKHVKTKQNASIAKILKVPSLEDIFGSSIIGNVVDRISKESISKGTVTLLDEENNDKIAETTVSSDGSFRFENLKSNKDYTLRLNTVGYKSLTKRFVIRDKTAIAQVFELNRLEDTAVEKGVLKKFETQNAVLFNFDSAHIRKDASKELDRLVTALLENPNMVIKIESHTDAIGNAAYNKYLSDKRAKATKTYLIANGVASSQIESAIGYGEEQLLNDCGDGQRCSIAKHRNNRRSEFIIVRS